jgi:hypothetical protein
MRRFKAEVVEITVNAKPYRVLSMWDDGLSSFEIYTVDHKDCPGALGECIYIKDYTMVATGLGRPRARDEEGMRSFVSDMLMLSEEDE